MAIHRERCEVYMATEIKPKRHVDPNQSGHTFSFLLSFFLSFLFFTFLTFFMQQNQPWPPFKIMLVANHALSLDTSRFKILTRFFFFVFSPRTTLYDHLLISDRYIGFYYNTHIVLNYYHHVRKKRKEKENNTWLSRSAFWDSQEENFECTLMHLHNSVLDIL